MGHPGPFLARLTMVAAAALVAIFLSRSAGAEQRGPMTHTIFLTALEVKGSTTTDKLAPPSVNPADVSKGYGFKGPGRGPREQERREPGPGQE